MRSSLASSSSSSASVGGCNMVTVVMFINFFPCFFPQGFDYEMCHSGLISDIGTNSNGRNTPAPQSGGAVQKSTRPWHDFGRQNEADKIQIPKL